MNTTKNKPNAVSKKKPTIKERKFASLKAQGKTNVEAYAEAGYSINKDKQINAVAASQINSRPHVQKLIDDALEKQGFTPEWAVIQLGKVASQDKEIGAKRLAAKDILELHGWNKAERPTMTLDIKNAFFGGGRQEGGRKQSGSTQYIEAEEN